MAEDRFIFRDEGEAAPDPSAERRRAEENLARFLADPENIARRPVVQAARRPAKPAPPEPAPEPPKPERAPPVNPKPVRAARPEPAPVAKAGPVEVVPPQPAAVITPQTVRVAPSKPVLFTEPPAPVPADLAMVPDPPVPPPVVGKPERKGGNARKWLGVVVQAVVFASLCAMVWLPTLYYLKTAPEVFQTSWRIILPGEGVKSSIDIDSVGEAKTSEKSIFASRNFDPRSTYREIAGSNIITKRARVVAELGDKEFGGPKIKVIPQTAILEFSLRRGDPLVAQDHAWIFMRSFDARVAELRTTELLSRKDAALDNVRALRMQLEEKQRAKLTLQRDAGLISVAEYKTIVENAGKRRETLTDAEVELRDLLEQFRALAQTLGVPPDVASQALVLKSDRLFQSLASAYVEARTELASIDGNFGKNFPDRVTTAARRDEYEARLIERIRELGVEPGKLSLMVDLTQSVERSELFATLVTMKAELAGRLAKVRELRAVVETADARTLDLAADADRVAAATQEADIANAILASSLANADLSQTNPYASYPLYQVLDEPKLPTRPISPKKVEAIAGAAGATLLIITGFAALWFRRRVLKRRQKKA